MLHKQKFVFDNSVSPDLNCWKCGRIACVPSKMESPLGTTTHKLLGSRLNEGYVFSNTTKSLSKSNKASMLLIQQLKHLTLQIYKIDLLARTCAGCHEFHS